MSDDIYIHPTALVESDTIGEGTRIWAFVHVMKDAPIGANCNIGDHTFVESGAAIGNGVTIKNGNMIWEGVTLEDGVFVGPHAFFTNDLYPRSARLPEAAARYETHDWLALTRVKRGASIGAAAVIIAGTAVGEYAMIGAGAVVTRDVPPHALMVGNPARRVGWVCACGEKLNLVQGRGACTVCERRYVQEGEALRGEV
jgi:acetyltransferase-like isoleucine patch superfamily enzyme